MIWLFTNAGIVGCSQTLAQRVRASKRASKRTEEAVTRSVWYRRQSTQAEIEHKHNMENPQAIYKAYRESSGRMNALYRVSCICRRRRVSGFSNLIVSNSKVDSIVCLGDEYACSYGNVNAILETDPVEARWQFPQRYEGRVLKPSP